MEKKLLPPKKVFRNKTEHYISMRKVKLEQYLKQLIKILVVPPLELLDFLNYPLYVCVYVRTCVRVAVLSNDIVCIVGCHKCHSEPLIHAV